MAADPDYRLARQRHLGNTLDDLESLGLLRWRWQYDATRSRAVYWIGPVEAAIGELQPLDTRAAEELVQANCDAISKVWRPVPAPGGRTQLMQTQQWIKDHS